MASQSYQLSFGFSVSIFIACIILAILTVALLIKAFGIITGAVSQITSVFSEKMEAPPTQVMQTLQEMETAAEEVLADKETSIQLDKRRHQTREALRSLQKDKTNDKVYLCFGNMFIKMPPAKAKTLLKKDFEQLDDEIDEIRTKLKKKVNKLRDIENKDELKGFDLKGLSKEDMAAVSGVL